MSDTPSPSKIAAARIPKITDLREQLGYGDGKLSRSAAFIDDLRIFRRRYQHAGLRGTDLWNWKSSLHQFALRQMTADFLDGDGYGEVYWPSDPTAANFNALQYSSDRTFITQTMRQLIFRLNLQQHRNEKYKRKIAHDSIEVEDDGESDLPIGHRGSSIECASKSPTLDSHGLAPVATANSSAKTQPKASGSLQWESGIHGDSTRPILITEPTASKRKSREPSGIDEQKRTKVVRLKLGTGNLPNPTLRPIAPMYTRTSPRNKKTRPPVNYVDIIDLDQPFSSPRSATESTLGYDNYGGADFPNRTITRERPIPEESDTNHTNTNQLSMANGSNSSTFSGVLPRTTIDSNIDPNLEHISSSSSFANSFTQESLVEPGESQPALRATSPSLSDTPAQRELYRMFAVDARAERLPKNVQAEAEKTPPVTHTMSRTAQIPEKSDISVPSTPMLPPAVGAKATAQPTIERVDTADSTTTTAILPENPRTVIVFNYRVILSRTPIYRSTCWEPKGRFLDKSLGDLIDELPFENKAGVVGLVIQFSCPGAAIEDKIERGREAKYDGTKKEIKEMAMMCLESHNKAKNGGELVMDFKIEALRESGSDECVSEDVVDLMF